MVYVSHCNILNFYVSHGSATSFLRNGEKYYIYFVDKLLLFPPAKQFLKLVNSWSYCKKFDTTFLKHSVCIVRRGCTCLFQVAGTDTAVIEKTSGKPKPLFLY